MPMNAPVELLHRSTPATPLVVRGIAGVVFGAIALLLPGIALGSLVLLFAVYLLADGVFAIAAAVRAARANDPWGWLASEGIVTIIAGTASVLMPGLTVVALMALLAIWACLSGVLLLIAAFSGRARGGRWWMAFAGLVSVAWGGLLFAWPGAGAIAVVIWLGTYALVFGIVLIVTGVRMRAPRHS